MSVENSDQLLKLPRAMGNNLVMRWGKPEDAQAVAEFNAKVHSDTAEPDGYVYYWTLELFQGKHPTVGPSDFLIVVDESKNNKIASTLCLISQTWSYEDIIFKVGRPEIVGTDEEYRRKGLVRAQFEVIHALSAERGEMVQGITGIPWYYRQFGYEMGLDLGGARRLYWPNVSILSKDKTETFKIRPATLEDIPLLGQLYQKNCESSLIRRVRNETEWRFELTRTNPKSSDYRQFFIIESMPTEGSTAEPVGYCEFASNFPGALSIIRELAVLQGISLRSVGEFLTRAIKALADEANKERKQALQGISFNFGQYHPIYEAMGNQLEKQIPPYAWFIRVPDLAGFIRHIAPVLERRLVGSVVEGFSGELKLNFYTSTLKLTFEKGKLVETGTFTPEKVAGGDALFPDLTFLQLLFGYRSLQDLRYARADCYYTNETTAVLLNVLFPMRPSRVIELT